MEKISADLKVIGTNNLLKNYLDKEFKALSIIANDSKCILCKLWNNELLEEIYFNQSPKIEITPYGITIEGMAQVGYLIGNIKVLLTNINK
jgi:hypothetical protein